MAYTTIDKPSDYFNTKLYTGNGGTQSITGVGFAPNWSWIKNRTSAEGSGVFDTVRGVTKMLCSQNSDGESTTANSLTAFGSDGFSVGANNRVNQNSNNIVSWNWKESATAGFDIVSYTGSGSAKTVAHNLGVKPDVIICKSRSGAEEWRPYFSALGATYGMRLNGTNAKDDDAGYWNDVEPTSSVFTVGTNAGTNGNNVTFIAYCFAEKKGYSKFGSYVGNGNVDGTFIWTGQKSAFIMIKATSGTENWRIYDNRRNGFNVDNEQLFANTNAAEASDVDLDILSNGFKCRRNSGGFNNSGTTYIFMAFAEESFVTSTGVPATAR